MFYFVIFPLIFSLTFISPPTFFIPPKSSQLLIYLANLLFDPFHASITLWLQNDH